MPSMNAGEGDARTKRTLFRLLKASGSEAITGEIRFWVSQLSSSVTLKSTRIARPSQLTVSYALRVFESKDSIGYQGETGND